MICQRCKSERVLSCSGKSSDLNVFVLGKNEHEGYVPHDCGIGGGDYYDFEICLDCGQIQGEFPLPTTELESKEAE